jgi:hypothetical protein
MRLAQEFRCLPPQNSQGRQTGLGQFTVLLSAHYYVLKGKALEN